MAFIAARNARAQECCAVKNGIARYAGRNSTQGQARQNRALGITAQNHVLHKYIRNEKHLPASCVTVSLKELNIK